MKISTTIKPEGTKRVLTAFAHLFSGEQSLQLLQWLERGNSIRIECHVLPRKSRTEQTIRNTQQGCRYCDGRLIEIETDGYLERVCERCGETHGIRVFGDMDNYA